MKFSIIILLLIACPVYSQEIYFYALSPKGKMIRSHISSEQYKENLKSTVLAVQNLIPNFDEQLTLGVWKLKTISIGVGSSGEIGLGPFKLGGGIRQRFYFGRD